MFADHSNSLSGRRILVAEDNFLEAQDMGQIILSASGTVLGPASTVERALWFVANEHLDGVVLNLKLADGPSSAVCRQLSEKNIPFLVVSGFIREALPQELQDAPFVAKPYDRLTFAAALALTFGTRGTLKR